jgi:hypothetical protein
MRTYKHTHTHTHTYIYIYIYIYIVGMATCYWLAGPGFESWWGEIFSTNLDRPRGQHSRISFPGIKRPERGADHLCPLERVSRMGRDIPLLPSVPTWHLTAHFYFCIYVCAALYSRQREWPSS